MMDHISHGVLLVGTGINDRTHGRSNLPCAFLYFYVIKAAIRQKARKRINKAPMLLQMEFLKFAHRKAYEIPHQVKKRAPKPLKSSAGPPFLKIIPMNSNSRPASNTRSNRRLFSLQIRNFTLSSSPVGWVERRKTKTPSGYPKNVRFKHIFIEIDTAKPNNPTPPSENVAGFQLTLLFSNSRYIKELWQHSQIEE